MYRSDIYDFLLTFYSNHGPISHCFRDRRRFQSKIATFPTPIEGMELVGGGIGIRYPWNWVTENGVKQLE